MAGLLVGGFIFYSALILAVVAFIIHSHNELVRLKNNVKNSFAQVDTQLQRRCDLIPNLVETVKAVAEHEQEILESVVAGKEAYANAKSEEEKLAVNSEISTNFKMVLAMTEQYPELKSNSNFLRLIDEIAETEDKVAFARQFYNDAVTLYNNRLQMFPSNLVASFFNFEEVTLRIEEEKDVPRIDFK